MKRLGESGDRYVSPYNVARIYGAIDDKPRALEWLERAYSEHNPISSNSRANPRSHVYVQTRNSAT